MWNLVLSVSFLFPLVTGEQVNETFALFTGGVRSLYLSQLEDKSCNVSLECSSALQKLQEGLESGSEWAYRFIDSSGSTTSGLFSGTVTSLGKFDECLSNPHCPAQYCVIEYYPTISETSSDAFKYLSGYPSLDWYNITSGMCMPRECSKNDVISLWSSWLPRLSMHLRNAESLKCTHGEDADFVYDVSSKAVFTLLLIMVLQLLIGFKSILFPGESPVEQMFSPFYHLKNIFRKSNRDVVQVLIMILTIVGHCVLCIDKIFPMTLVANYEFLDDLFGQIWTQMSNELIFSFYAVLGGFFLFSRLKNTSRSLVTSWWTTLFDRYLALMPVIMCLVLSEMAWPFFARGPFHIKMANRLISDCLANWWKHPLVMGHHEPLTSCVTHTFFSSIHLHLLALGIPFIYLLLRMKRLAIFIMIISASFCYWILFLSAKTLKRPTVFTRTSNARDMINYGILVHFPTYPYIPLFLAGIISADSVQSNNSFYSKLRFHPINTATAIYTILSAASVLSLWFAPAIHNVFELLTPPMYPFFIVGVRVLFAFSASNMIAVIWTANKGTSCEKSNSSPPDGTPDSIKSNDSSSWQIPGRSILTILFNAISRLSFSLHMVNYLVIKYDFVSSRTLFTLYPFRTFERILSYFTLMLPVALIFDIFFTCPLNQVRRLVMNRLTKNS